MGARDVARVMPLRAMLQSCTFTQRYRIGVLPCLCEERLVRNGGPASFSLRGFAWESGRSADSTTTSASTTASACVSTRKRPEYYRAIKIVSLLSSSGGLNTSFKINFNFLNTP